MVTKFRTSWLSIERERPWATRIGEKSARGRAPLMPDPGKTILNSYQIFKRGRNGERRRLTKFDKEELIN